MQVVSFGPPPPDFFEQPVLRPVPALLDAGVGDAQRLQELSQLMSMRLLTNLKRLRGASLAKRERFAAARFRTQLSALWRSQFPFGILCSAGFKPAARSALAQLLGNCLMAAR